MKIITHQAPNHIDEVLAISLLLTKYNAEIVLVKNVNDIKIDEDDIIVDIGNEYNPALKRYDHHHDQNLPASFVLVLKNEFDIKEDEMPLTLKYYSLLDTKGFIKAREELNLGKQIIPLLDSFFIKHFFPGNKDVLKNLGMHILELCNLQRKTIEQLSRCIIYTTKKGKIIISDEWLNITTISELDSNIKVVVGPNREPNLLSITRVTSESENQFNLEPLKEISKFFHPSGFMCAVEKEKYKDVINILIDIGNK